MSDLVPSTSAAVMGRGLDAVELPSKLTVVRGPGVFEVSWKWREQVSRAAFFAPFLSSMSALGGLSNLAIHSPLAFAAVALGVVGVAGGFAAAYAKNTMRVRVTQGALVLTSGPIGGRTIEIAADDVVDVVAAQRQVRRRRSPALWSVTLLLKAPPGQKPKKPRAIVGFMMQQAQAEEIARLVREALFRA